jgi:hypothetical protein
MLLTTIHPNKLLQQHLVLMLFVHARILDRINRNDKTIKQKNRGGKALPLPRGSTPKGGGVFKSPKGEML